MLSHWRIIPLHLLACIPLLASWLLTPTELAHKLHTENYTCWDFLFNMTMKCSGALCSHLLLATHKWSFACFPFSLFMPIMFGDYWSTFFALQEICLLFLILFYDTLQISSATAELQECDASMSCFQIEAHIENRPLTHSSQIPCLKEQMNSSTG